MSERRLEPGDLVIYRGLPGRVEASWSTGGSLSFAQPRREFVRVRLKNGKLLTCRARRVKLLERAHNSRPEDVPL